ncbi:MAG: hypothetical protein HZB30_08410 [Nitrospirae bacterium]|nr:hypothetical protein [Nitrospirota bacterium]
MSENIITKNIEPGHSSRVYDSIERMLTCLLSKTEKNCKNCKDCDACSFLTQAVFTVGYKQNTRIKIHKA